MPFTPIHLGPGLLLKAVGGERLSLATFTLSQLLIDLEPLVRMLRGDWVLHGPSHTIAGATLVAALAVVPGRALCQRLLRHPRLLGGGWRIGGGAAVAGALAGAYSHLAIDALMYVDVRLWWPFAAGNPLLDRVPFDAVTPWCLGAGAVGGAVWWWRGGMRAGRSD